MRWSKASLAKRVLARATSTSLPRAARSRARLHVVQRETGDALVVLGDAPQLVLADQVVHGTGEGPPPAQGVGLHDDEVGGHGAVRFHDARGGRQALCFVTWESRARL